MKNIEEAVKKNRALLDVEEPDDMFIWSGINRKLDKRRNMRFAALRLAAVIVLMIAIGITVLFYEKGRQTKAMLTLSDISPALKAEENLFVLTIDERMNEIQQTGINREDYKTFFEEIEILDNYYAAYLADLQKMGNNPRLIQAMLHYYELKIRILEKMLNEIEKRKNHENKRKIL